MLWREQQLVFPDFESALPNGSLVSGCSADSVFVLGARTFGLLRGPKSTGHASLYLLPALILKEQASMRAIFHPFPLGRSLGAHILFYIFIRPLYPGIVQQPVKGEDKLKLGKRKTGCK